MMRKIPNRIEVTYLVYGYLSFQPRSCTGDGIRGLSASSVLIMLVFLLQSLSCLEDGVLPLQMEVEFDNAHLQRLLNDP